MRIQKHLMHQLMLQSVVMVNLYQTVLVDLVPMVIGCSTARLPARPSFHHCPVQVSSFPMV